MRTLMLGHTSAETAFVQPDYPYGFELRCQRRCWIETKSGHGQRFVTQTSNPKKAGLVWNKPKASTYSTICVMVLNSENGHVEQTGLHLYTYLETIETFVAEFGEQALSTDPWIRDALKVMRKVATRRDAPVAPVTFVERSVSPGVTAFVFTPPSA